MSDIEDLIVQFCKQQSFAENLVHGQAKPDSTISQNLDIEDKIV